MGRAEVTSLPLGTSSAAPSITTGLADMADLRLTSGRGWSRCCSSIDAAGILVWNVLTVAFRQRIIPTELLGRVGASYRFMLFLGAPVGALLGGALASSRRRQDQPSAWPVPRRA